MLARRVRPCHPSVARLAGERTRAEMLVGLLKKHGSDDQSRRAVLTSSAPADPSFEDERWGNGALSEAFLDALRTHADRDKDGLLSVGDIEWYIGRRLPELTGGRQSLGIEKRFDGNIFVAGL